jgi:hypothetical protein
MYIATTRHNDDDTFAEPPGTPWQNNLHTSLISESDDDDESESDVSSLSLPESHGEGKTGKTGG